MDKLTAMLTFVRVVETGSFTRAAEALELPKARVSQRITDLERLLGIRLLHRTTRTMGLTEEGTAYYERCLEILSEIEELEGSLKGETANPQGKVRVEVLASIARYLLAPRLPEFKAKFPDISLRFGCSDRISNLFEEGIDCAIRGGHLEDSSLIAKHICNVHLGLYASPDYLLTHGPVNTPKELLAHQKISWFSSRNHRPLIWQLQSTQESREIDGPYDWLFDDNEVSIAACVAGVGICPAAPFAVESLVHAGALCAVLPQWSFPPRQLNIIYPSTKYLSVRVRSFVDWAFNVLQTHPSLSLKPWDLHNRG
ncbi:LysR family transcriptional regulator [Serratia sp. D1N4]